MALRGQRRRHRRGAGARSSPGLSAGGTSPIAARRVSAKRSVRCRRARRARDRAPRRQPPGVDNQRDAVTRLLQERLDDVTLEHDVAERHSVPGTSSPSRAPATTPRSSPQSPFCRCSARRARRRGRVGVRGRRWLRGTQSARSRRAARRGSAAPGPQHRLGRRVVRPPKSERRRRRARPRTARRHGRPADTLSRLLQLLVAWRRKTSWRRHLRLDVSAANPRGAEGAPPSPAWR